jgi:polynucleotide 5'-kinase involved in rRNA processing
MSRYQPTADEQAAIDLLRLAGYAVVRQATYDKLRERVTTARHEVQWQTEWREHSDAWARRECDEQRRLADRLTAVVGAAAAQGVTIQAINEALEAKP